MSLSKKGKLNYRCPQCFSRDIDMDMFYDEDKKEYYCLRCGFVGDENRVLMQNEQIKEKYKFLKMRIVSFNDDNEKITFKEYKKEEE